MKDKKKAKKILNKIKNADEQFVNEDDKYIDPDFILESNGKAEKEFEQIMKKEKSIMSDRIKKFDKFCKKYDLYGDGIEEQIVLYLKNIFPKSYKKSQEHLINEDELPSPYDIYGFTSEDKKTEEDFFKVVEKWFKENKY